MTNNPSSNFETYRVLVSTDLGGDPDDIQSLIHLLQCYPNYYTDLDAPAEVCQATINKWRVAYLSHWKVRWDWYDE